MTRAKPTVHISTWVRLRPHPTVVRLEEEGSAAWVRETFVVTEALRGHLAAFEALLARQHGAGVFLIGQYGSGKSHFLAYLRQCLVAGELGGRTPRVVTCSLLNFPATASLEEVVCGALSLPVPAGDRRPVWSTLLELASGGLVLLLDELSEFLRSKPSAAAFTEDLRFLQYLGELASGQPLWVLAALQEQIEHTGELEHSLYRKIKDRYPLRLLLTPTHVEELVARSILEKLPGYDDAVEELVADFRGAHPELDRDAKALRRLYPLHPATLELLEEVRDLFSQSRGVVDFVAGQLGGVPEKGIAPLLDAPWGSLLTPDLIVAHFADLFEVQPEFVALAQQVLPWYRRELPNLFGEPARRELAQKLLHLLVLVHISPNRSYLTVADAVRFLVPRISRLAPQKNHEVLGAILETLAKSGRYVTAGRLGYQLDLAEDGAVLFEQLLEAERQAVAAQPEATLIEELAASLDGDTLNPLQLPRELWQQRQVRWHFHDRPYAVRFDHTDPEPGSDPERRIEIVVRPPWGEPGGEQRPAPGCFTVVPRPLEIGADHIELAALTRLRQRRSWSPQQTRRLEERERERRAVFASRLEQAYCGATLFDRDGGRHNVPRLPNSAALETFLDTVAAWALEQVYPAFGRFAPTHGPLPRESYRRLLQVAFEQDLGAETTDPQVKLVREAYLVPMRLLLRSGRSYRLAGHLERHELAHQILPLLASRPDPASLLQQLAAPPYGLVRDQVGLLLAVLVVAGEIEITKRGTSLREGYAALPDPLAWDRVERVTGLGAEHLRILEELAGGLELPRVREWTAGAQLRVAGQLRDRARRLCGELTAVASRLAESGEGGELRGRVDRMLALWMGLGDDPEGLPAFLDAAAPVRETLAELADLQQLPGRLERLGRERQRFLHLLGHPTLAAAASPEVALRLEALEQPPSVGLAAELQDWLEAAGSLYRDHQEDYRARHDRYWSELVGHPIWTWNPPQVAELALLGLGPTVSLAREAQAKARRMSCPRLVDLAYQPACSCGLTRKGAPIAEVLANWTEHAAAIDDALASYFAEPAVKQRVSGWLAEGLAPAATLDAYLAGASPFPASVPEPTLFDRHLAGAGVVREIPLARLAEVLGGTVVTPRELVGSLDRYLGELGSSRVRVATAPATSSHDAGLARFAAALVLRAGHPVPGALRRILDLADDIDLADVGQATLARLDELGLGEATVRAILLAVGEGRLEPEATTSPSPLVAAALELIRPATAAEPRALASQTTRLYRADAVLAPVFTSRWLARLDALAATQLEAVPSLFDLLAVHRHEQILVIDGLGLALVEALEGAATRLFPGRTVCWLGAGLVGAESTTAGWYGELLAHGLGDRAFPKIEVVDQLLHQRGLEFAELEQLAVAHLAVALGRVAAQFDPAAPILLTADHGFRRRRQGGFGHGGPSTLERVVPLWRLEPK